MGDVERLLYLGGALRVLLGFNHPFSLIVLNLEENRHWTRKGIMFWVEKLIIKLAEELGFRGTRFHRGILSINCCPKISCNVRVSSLASNLSLLHFAQKMGHQNAERTVLGT